MFNVFDFYEKMGDGKIMLSFKGQVTPDLISSILQIIESKLNDLGEAPEHRQKIKHILDGCLQNLYQQSDTKIPLEDKASLFLIGRNENALCRIITGNYMLNSDVTGLRARIEQLNAMSREKLEELFSGHRINESLSNEEQTEYSMLDIAYHSGKKMEYSFTQVNDSFSFFSLSVTIGKD